MCGRRLRKLFVLFLVLAWVPQLVMASWPVRQPKLPAVEEVETVVVEIIPEEIQITSSAPVEESLQTELTPSETSLSEAELKLLKKEWETLQNELAALKNYKNEEQVAIIESAFNEIVATAIKNIETGAELKTEAFKSEQSRADAAELAYASAKAENAKLIKEKNKLGVFIMPKGFYDIHSDQWGFGLNLGLVKGGVMSGIGVEKTITSWDSFKNTDNMRVSVGFGFIL